MGRTVKSGDSYLSRVLKHIPSEIVLAYISIEGVLQSAYANRPELLQTILWVVAALLLFITPLWLYRVERVHRFSQLVLSSVSVLFWMFAIGGPFRSLSWYDPALGAVALPFYTLLVPILTGKDV